MLKVVLYISYIISVIASYSPIRVCNKCNKCIWDRKEGIKSSGGDLFLAFIFPATYAHAKCALTENGYKQFQLDPDSFGMSRMWPYNRIYKKQMKELMKGKSNDIRRKIKRY